MKTENNWCLDISYLTTPKHAVEHIPHKSYPHNKLQERRHATVADKEDT